MSNETFLTYGRTYLNQDQTGRRAPSTTRCQERFLMSVLPTEASAYQRRNLVQFLRENPPHHS